MDTKTLGNNIRKRREQLGISQGELARRMGWVSGNSRISNYESGYREPNLADLHKMAEALETSIVSLLLDPAALPEGVTAEELGTVLLAFFEGTDELRQLIKDKLRFDSDHES